MKLKTPLMSKRKIKKSSRTKCNIKIFNTQKYFVEYVFISSLT